jgi:hypothetical protein
MGALKNEVGTKFDPPSQVEACPLKAPRGPCPPLLLSSTQSQSSTTCAMPLHCRGGLIRDIGDKPSPAPEGEKRFLQSTCTCTLFAPIPVCNEKIQVTKSQ